MFGALSLCLAMQAQQTTLERDPGVIVSKVFQRYWDAQTLSGTIVQSSTDGQGTVKITTKVTYKRPGHILVQQDYKGRNGLLLSLVSDDKKFAYDPPFDSVVKPPPGQRLYEPRVLTNPGVAAETTLVIGDMYHAAHKSLMPSTLLDLAIAYKEHLKDFRINVATAQLDGVVAVAGKQAYKVSGTWRPYIGAADVQMRYELYVSLEFDLLQFKLSQPISVNGRIVTVTTTENADLKLNVPVDDALFVVK